MFVVGNQEVLPVGAWHAFDAEGLRARSGIKAATTAAAAGFLIFGRRSFRTPVRKLNRCERGQRLAHGSAGGERRDRVRVQGDQLAEIETGDFLNVADRRLKRPSHVRGS